VKPTLCLDFDGVIHSYASPWLHESFIPDQPVDGAFEWMIQAAEHFELAIYSSRSRNDDGIRAMQLWLQHWGRKWADGNMDKLSLFNDMFNRLVWSQTKPAAFLTIDDRAHAFDGTWPNIGMLLEFKPWNKKG
jgi:hypothetical protein